MTDPAGRTSRRDHPERPEVRSALPPAPSIRRPIIVWLVPILTVLSVGAFVPTLVLTYRERGPVRRNLETQLSDLRPDYPADDVQTAVLAGLIVMIGLGIVFSLAELRASVRLLDKHRGARTGLLWLAVFHVPLIAAGAQLRGLGRYHDLITWVQGGSLVLAVVVAYWFSVGRWLTAAERQGPIPLRPSSGR